MEEGAHKAKFPVAGGSYKAALATAEQSLTAKQSAKVSGREGHREPCAAAEEAE